MKTLAEMSQLYRVSLITDEEQICPVGYIEKSGDIVGPGIETTRASSIEECAYRCSINPDCCVFEYESSIPECQLHQKCVPDYLGSGPSPNCPYNYYVFCQSSKYISPVSIVNRLHD